MLANVWNRYKSWTNWGWEAGKQTTESLVYFLPFGAIAPAIYDERVDHGQQSRLIARRNQSWLRRAYTRSVWALAYVPSQLVGLVGGVVGGVFGIIAAPLANANEILVDHRYIADHLDQARGTAVKWAVLGAMASAALFLGYVAFTFGASVLPIAVPLVVPAALGFGAVAGVAKVVISFGSYAQRADLLVHARETIDRLADMPMYLCDEQGRIKAKIVRQPQNVLQPYKLEMLSEVDKRLAARQVKEGYAVCTRKIELAQRRDVLVQEYLQEIEAIRDCIARGSLSEADRLVQALPQTLVPAQHRLTDWEQGIGAIQRMDAVAGATIHDLQQRVLSLETQSMEASMHAARAELDTAPWTNDNQPYQHRSVLLWTKPVNDWAALDVTALSGMPTETATAEVAPKLRKTSSTASTA